MSLDLMKIENLGLQKVLSRGTAEILEKDDNGCVYRKKLGFVEGSEYVYWFTE